MILGPDGLAVLQDKVLLSRLGAIGVVLLLFFIGMEISPQRMLANWRISVLGTFLQILFSVACVWLLGIYLSWPLERTVLMGFVISMSSTAVVLRLLDDWREVDTTVGQNVLGILLAQDLAVIPMLIILGLLGGAKDVHGKPWLQLLGMVVIAAVLLFKDRIRLPTAKLFGHDHDIQVFAALFICLGFSLLTGLLGLSTALGAFVAGMVVRAAKETEWVHHSLEPFRIVFIALFFVSIGMLMDLNFLRVHWGEVSAVIGLVLLTNTFINGFALRALGSAWRDSLYAGALLSQIGEFSFVLAAVGIQAHIISEFGYQMTLAVISLSLLISPFWIWLMKRALKIGI